MPFGRLHEEAAGDGKLLALSDAGWRMWGMGLIYCQKNLTDGFIPEHAIHSFGIRATNKVKVAEELCTVQVPGKASLWKKVKSGFQVHDYLDWNDSRAEILEARQQARDRQKRWRGKRTGDALQPTEGDALGDALHPPEDPPLHPGEGHALPVESGSGDLEKKRVVNPTNAELRRMPRLVDGPHVHHALCGRVCLHVRQFRDFVRKLGGNERESEQRVTAWFTQVNASYAGKSIPIADEFKFWNAEYDRAFGAPIERSDGQKSTVPTADRTAEYLKRQRQE